MWDAGFIGSGKVEQVGDGDLGRDVELFVVRVLREAFVQGHFEVVGGILMSRAAVRRLRRFVSLAFPVARADEGTMR